MNYKFKVGDRVRTHSTQKFNLPTLLRNQQTTIKAFCDLNIYDICYIVLIKDVECHIPEECMELLSEITPEAWFDIKLQKK